MSLGVFTPHGFDAEDTASFRCDDALLKAYEPLRERYEALKKVDQKALIASKVKARSARRRSGM